MTSLRRASIRRETSETRISATVDLDGTGSARVATGIGFLDHMLAALARHGMFDLELSAEGDLHVDAHHTTEDTGIVLGQAVAQALGERRGIRRYGAAAIPMDEALAEAAVDVSGRPFLAWDVRFPTMTVGGMDTELFVEWFRAFATNPIGDSEPSNVVTATTAMESSSGMLPRSRVEAVKPAARPRRLKT